MNNHWNQLLPEVIRVDLAHDESDSLHQIEQSVAEIATTLREKARLVENKMTGKLVRQISTHLSMKYILTVAMLDSTVGTLMDLFLSNHLSVPMKIRVLDSMKSLLKAANSKFLGPSGGSDGANHNNRMKFRFNYLPIWRDIMNIISRDGRGTAVCSEQILSELLTAMVDFLHGARQYIRTDGTGDESIEALVEEAMHKLRDVRFTGSVEGVVMLVTCLPTFYDHYDTLVPRWVECWLGGAVVGVVGSADATGGLDHCPHWDYAWLTLLARARKHYIPSADSEFSWRSLLPVLLAKVPQLMTIPASASVEGTAAVQHASYPHTFPPHYARLLMVQSTTQQASAEPRDMALRKLTKLLYFITSTITLDAGNQVELVPALQSSLTPPECAAQAIALAQVDSMNQPLRVLPGAVDVMQLLLSLRVYFYPSNVGAWTPLLSNFFIMYVVQMCRHIGHSIATTLEGASPSHKSHIHRVHLPTVQYLLSNLLPFCLEGMYSKNPYMSQCCVQCVKNLCTVQPALCAPMVVPFLLAALDPAAVSQAHQAPVAMQTLSAIFKTLMFPEPVLLPYLQDILKLSLPGIEPSDVMKTSITINLYATVLAWLPTTLKPVSESRGPYIDLLRGSSVALGEMVDVECMSLEIANDHLAQLSDYIATDWASSLLTRLFALLEAQEVLVEGAKPSPLAGSIGQVGSYLFQAVADLPGLESTHPLQVKQRQLREALQSQLRKYFATTTPLNGVKASAKLIEAMVTASPEILSSVLHELLTPTSASNAATDISGALLHAFSADKVAFRLRLAGGACRAATSAQIAPSLALLKSIVSSSAFFNHEEKAVRTATSKLLKDILKGSTSLYPTALRPSFLSNADRPIGFPNTISVGKVQWHVPDANSMTSIVSLLRIIVSDSLDEIRNSLLSASADLPNPAASVSASASASTVGQVQSSNAANSAFKKSEELLVSRLTMVEKALRGSAEILSDLSEEQEDLASIASADAAPLKVASTGREALIATLDPADRQFLRTLRLQVLRFLIFFQETISTLIPATHPYSALKNNITVQTLWVGLFNLVVTRRMACLHDIDQVRKYLRYTVKVGRSSITNVVYHRLKASASTTTSSSTTPAGAGGAGGSWEESLRELQYWKFHDTSTSGIACLAWAQHILRCKALSYESIRRCHVPSLTRCLNILRQRLCSHEYDQIRKLALKQFDTISTRFGSKMLVTVQEVVNSLQTPGSNYWEASGAMAVLAQSRVQKRIMGDSPLLRQFLQVMLLQSQAVIQNATEEADKREKLTHQVVEVMLKYVKRWCTSPELTGSDDNLYMLNLALASAGCAESGDLAPLSAAIGTGKAVDGKSGLGLRFETFAAFMAAHIVGRPACIDLQRPDAAVSQSCASTSPALWQWAIGTLSNAQMHSQPPQGVALAALSRLAHLLAQKGETNAEARQCADYIRTQLSPTSPSSALRAVVISVALAHPRSGEDGTSAQWGGGIEQVLQASQFLKVILPRRSNGLRTEQCTFSTSFRKEDAAVFMSLAQADLLRDNATAVTDQKMFTAANLTALFACTSDLPSSSEAEKRLNNVVRAEVFAGVLRAYRQHALRTSSFGSPSSAEVEQVFMQVLQEGVEKASLDYARDFMEATCFAYSDVPCCIPQPGGDLIDPFASYVLERLVQVVLSPTAQGNLSQASEGDPQAAESFANQSKVLCLACALLKADQEASFTNLVGRAPSQTHSVFGELLLKLLRDHAENGLVSPYRSTRNDISFLLHLLSENHSRGRPDALSDICIVIAKACEGNAVPASDDSTMEVDATAAAAAASVIATTSAVSAAQVQVFKNAAETVCLLLRCAVHNLPAWRFQGIWKPLFSAALIGAGSMTSSAIETAKMCHDTCLLVCNGAVRMALQSNSLAVEQSSDLINCLLQYLWAAAKDKATPLHSRETSMKCVSLLMGNNRSALTANERKTCRDIFALGLEDVKPEVQQLAQAGMVAYLGSYKTVQELGAIAAVYVKNSDILAAREKKQKKANEGNTTAAGTSNSSSRVDPKHHNTVYMMSCVILATPYDMPHTYLPSLLTSFVRHAAFPSLRDTVTRTVQLFKRTHQDRWDEFKKSFSVDQLDELQGTGAAHYYS